MPEHSPDPLRDLKDFGLGGTVLTPLEPAQVRRLGDRRRARRRGATAAIAAVAVVAALSPVLLLNNGASDTGSPADGVSTPASSPSSTPPTLRR
ncbi:hypothetical protein [Nocardioides mesophilus]|uniref:Uncharacterized protein n=1 Tax=Nocardioides mesophilus TaxID=433659 RepID=A0A7G9R6R7_9ACTN|nr:hypothetical protein [Nocardioides mesophilus]QNN51292.1 hypothetical protein H9L09_11700 [Nocardioides mesophilus]